MEEVVIDLGSHSTRIGHAGCSNPSSTFRTTLGFPKWKEMIPYPYLVGDDAMSKIGLLSMRYPIHRGNGVLDIFSFFMVFFFYIFF